MIPVTRKERHKLRSNFKIKNIKMVHREKKKKKRMDFINAE